MDPIKSAREIFTRLYGRPPSGTELGDTLLAFAAFTYLDYGQITVEQFNERVRQILPPGPLRSFGVAIVSSAHYPWFE